MTISNFIDSNFSDFSEISEKELRSPGTIQEHGLLFVLQEPDLIILQVSENIESILGIAATALINQPLSQLLSSSELNKLQTHLANHNIEWFNCLDLQFNKQEAIFQGFLRRQTEGLILELDIPSYAFESLNYPFYHLFRDCNSRLNKAKKNKKLAQQLVKEIREITKFDRVILYRFHEDNSGVVIAEEKAENVTPLLGLHFPATDIPNVGRNLYYQNFLNLISNINAEPVPIIPRHNSLSQNPLDLSFSILRTFAPCHIQYLKNMGLSANMSMGLIHGEKLWGIIACHPYSPKYLAYNLRQFCQFLAASAVEDLVTLEDIQPQDKEAILQQLKTYLKTPVDHEKNLLTRLIDHDFSPLLNLVHAQGAALCYGDTIILVGKTPPQTTVQHLRDWLKKNQQQNVFFTHNLGQIYPEGKAIKNEASGLLTISILLKAYSYHIIWFRPEVIQTVNWAGDPHDNFSFDNNNQVILSPRYSFELWKEIVKETSLPWQTSEIKAAEQLRDIFLLAALEFSHSVMEDAVRKAEAANRAKSEFLANMSHELRTPLNAILGFSQIMRRSPDLPQEHQENLSIINRSGEHLLTLINQVLDLSKIEAGRITIHPSNFDFHNLLDDLEDLFQSQAQAKGLQLLCERSPYLPQYICTDQVKLRQVLINLLNNAIKFTTEGGVSLRVALKPFAADTEPSPYQTVIVEIEDTGPGIAPQDLDELFEPFVQTQTGQELQEGTGLGLPISRQFVRLLGGELAVNSRLGQGTLFSFEILVEEIQPTDLDLPQPQRRVIALQPDQPAYRILVVDDRLSNRELMLKLLKPLGFRVKSAKNGQEAIDLWEEWEPHLIWMDMRMPVMDGYESTRRIKSTIKGQATAIIALTASVFEEDKAVVLSTGCDGFIRKPFREAEIFQVMEKQIGVKFIYDNDHSFLTPVSKNNLKPQITAETLMQLSPTWLANLKQALTSVDIDTIAKLTQQIESDYPEVAAGISYYVDNFEYEKLSSLLSNQS